MCSQVLSTSLPSTRSTTSAKHPSSPPRSMTALPPWDIPPSCCVLFVDPLRSDTHSYSISYQCILSWIWDIFSYCRKLNFCWIFFHTTFVILHLLQLLQDFCSYWGALINNFVCVFKWGINVKAIKIYCRIRAGLTLVCLNEVSVYLSLLLEAAALVKHIFTLVWLTQTAMVASHVGNTVDYASYLSLAFLTQGSRGWTVCTCYCS